MGAGFDVPSETATRARRPPLSLTMLSDGPAVADLVFVQDVAGHIAEGAIVIDMSSICPHEARHHHALLAALHFAH